MEAIRRRVEELNQRKVVTTPQRIDYMADKAWL